MANPTTCLICNGTIDADGPSVRKVAAGSVCGSCYHEADRATLERLNRKAPMPAASPATRVVLTALADRLRFTAPTAAELVAAGVRRSLDALIAGDLVAYTIEGFALADAIESLRKAMNEAMPTLKTIESLDPAYFAAANAATMSTAIRDYRRRFAGVSDIEVIKSYAIHLARCSHAEGCIENAAILEELKSRRIEVPK